MGAAPQWLRQLARADPSRLRGERPVAKGVLLREPKVSPRASEEQLEMLRAMGYVE